MPDKVLVKNISMNFYVTRTFEQIKQTKIAAILKFK